MKCPRCAGVPLETFHLAGGVVVDYCDKCRGMWFERGEVGQHARFSSDIPNLKEAVKAGKPGVKCPACGDQRAVEIPYTPDAKLLVDYCAACGGTWFDGGELDTLEELAENPEHLKLKLGRAVYDIRRKMGRTGDAKRCPKCAAPTLEPFKTSENVEVDFCSKCKGIWLQKGETANAAELESDIPELATVRKGARQTDCACPDCGSAKLEEMRFSTKHALLIDYCGRCGGVWLDAGELRTLESVSTQLEGAAKRLGRVFAELDRAGYQAL